MASTKPTWNANWSRYGSALALAGWQAEWQGRRLEQASLSCQTRAGHCLLVLSVKALNARPEPSDAGYRSRVPTQLSLEFFAALGHPLRTLSGPLSQDTVEQYRAVAVADTARRMPVMTVHILDGQPVMIGGWIIGCGASGDTAGAEHQGREREAGPQRDDVVAGRRPASWIRSE
jgi:hypothetical protein